VPVGKRTPEFVERCRELRAQGLTHRQIGAELSASHGTVSLALRFGANVPHEHVSAVRRDIWRDRLFRDSDERELWNRQRIIAAIQAWERRTGKPPLQTEWARPNRGGSGLLDSRRARRPGSRTVARYFGSWNAGIEAAGFVPRAPVTSPRVDGRCRNGLHDVSATGLTTQGACRECNLLAQREWRRRQREARAKGSS
jgi:hypothetical protein